MVDFVEDNNAALRFKNLTIVKDYQGALQHVTLYKHDLHGFLLVIDGELQHVEDWHYLYHEPLVHLPASFIPSIESVLILGGGDFFAASEALKYESVKEVVLYDHDSYVTDLMIEVYPHAAKVMKDPRFQLVNDDALVPLVSGKKKYDLIINDCFDLINHFSISDIDIYNAIYGALSDQGICSDLVYRSVYERQTLREAMHRLKDLKTVSSLVSVPEYPGIMHILTLWGKNKNLSQKKSETVNKEQKDRCKKSSMSLKYYDPLNLKFHLYVPPYIEDIIEAT